jgi:hypothetical protein
MNKKKVIQRKFVLEVQYLLPERDEEGRVLRSGIQVPTESVKNELQVDVSNDPIFDWDADKFVDSGKYQINLRGTRRALNDLGTLLIALAHYEEDPSYDIHIDDIKDSTGQAAVHLIVHVPSDMTAS